MKSGPSEQAEFTEPLQLSVALTRLRAERVEVLLRAAEDAANFLEDEPIPK